MDEETLNTIQKVSKKMSTKYAFINYDKEDIEQEAFIMCINAIPRYNGSIPLEHFLLCHLSNRLKNLKRDKANARHASIIYATSIDVVSQQNESFLLEDNVEDNMHCEEIKRKIDLNLPAEYREDYLMMINGISIPPTRRKKIRDMIENILFPSSYLEKEDE